MKATVIHECVVWYCSVVCRVSVARWCVSIATIVHDMMASPYRAYRAVRGVAAKCAAVCSCVDRVTLWLHVLRGCHPWGAKGLVL